MKASYARASFFKEDDGWDSGSSSGPEGEDERTVDFIDEASASTAAQTSGKAKRGECSSWPGLPDSGTGTRLGRT